MAEALERVTNLLALLLESRVPLTLEQISGELAGQYPPGTAARRGAFERDKSLLRDVGVPIESAVLAGSQAGKTAYSIDRNRYELADLQLDTDERQALQLAVATVRSSNAQFGLLKLGGDTDGSSVVVAHVPELDELPVLREAVASRSVATFRYRAAERRLHPYALLLREGFWYVIGHDEAHDSVRTYRVDRIEGSVAVGRPAAFERPDGFDPRVVFPSDPKELGEATAARAEVRVDSARAGMVLRELGPEAVLRHEPGVKPGAASDAIVFGVPCANVDAFRSWLFGLGEHAVVLGPPAVRAEVVSWLRAMAAR